MYALLAVIGLVVAGLIFCLRIYRAGYDENDAVIFLLILGGGMVVGGKTNIRESKPPFRKRRRQAKTQMFNKITEIEKALLTARLFICFWDVEAPSPTNREGNFAAQRHRPLRVEITGTVLTASSFFHNTILTDYHAYTSL